MKFHRLSCILVLTKSLDKLFWNLWFFHHWNVIFSSRCERERPNKTYLFNKYNFIISEQDSMNERRLHNWISSRCGLKFNLITFVLAHSLFQSFSLEKPFNLKQSAQPRSFKGDVFWRELAQTLKSNFAQFCFRLNWSPTAY